MPKILIIEDEPMLRDMYEKRFQKEDFIVITANDAENGVALAKKEMPDIILLDILLPRNNGLQALQEMREDEATKNIKVIAFSNYDDPIARANAKELAAIDYLLKTSFTPSEIVEKVKKHI